MTRLMRAACAFGCTLILAGCSGSTPEFGYLEVTLTPDEDRELESVSIGSRRLVRSRGELERFPEALQEAVEKFHRTGGRQLRVLANPDDRVSARYLLSVFYTLSDDRDGRERFAIDGFGLLTPEGPATILTARDEQRLFEKRELLTIQLYAAPDGGLDYVQCPGFFRGRDGSPSELYRRLDELRAVVERAPGDAGKEAARAGLPATFEVLIGIDSNLDCRHVKELVATLARPIEGRPFFDTIMISHLGLVEDVDRQRRRREDNGRDKRGDDKGS